MNEITLDMGVKQAAIAARRHKSGKAASFCMSFGMLPFERTGKKTLNVKKGAYQVRTHLPGLSLRTGAHTGVAIRSPRRETWQAGCCLGKFVTPYVFALSAAFCHVLPQELRIATSLRSSQ